MALSFWFGSQYLFLDSPNIFNDAQSVWSLLNKLLDEKTLTDLPLLNWFWVTKGFLKNGCVWGDDEFDNWKGWLSKSFFDPDVW